MRAGGVDGEVVRAAGGVVWRPVDHGVEVVVIRRDRHADWSLPKGKLDPGETWVEAAVREVGEETGLAVEVGEFLGQVEYATRGSDGHPPRRKRVRYWVMRARDGSTPHGALPPGGEVSEVRWLPVPEAVQILSYHRDRALVNAFYQRVTGTR